VLERIAVDVVYVFLVVAFFGLSFALIRPLDRL